MYEYMFIYKHNYIYLYIYVYKIAQWYSQNLQAIIKTQQRQLCRKSQIADKGLVRITN